VRQQQHSHCHLHSQQQQQQQQRQQAQAYCCRRLLLRLLLPLLLMRTLRGSSRGCGGCSRRLAVTRWGGLLGCRGEAGGQAGMGWGLVLGGGAGGRGVGEGAVGRPRGGGCTRAHLHAHMNTCASDQSFMPDRVCQHRPEASSSWGRGHTPCCLANLSSRQPQWSAHGCVVRVQWLSCQHTHMPLPACVCAPFHMSPATSCRTSQRKRRKKTLQGSQQQQQPPQPPPWRRLHCCQQCLQPPHQQQQQWPHQQQQGVALRVPSLLRLGVWVWVMEMGLGVTVWTHCCRQTGMWWRRARQQQQHWQHDHR
jgi:hypothetical protein